MKHALCHRNRAGLTALELLVAISLLALLFSLLLPAVQQAREQSRMTQCRGNLQGFGQALHGFESAHQVFPPIMPGVFRKTDVDGGRKLVSRSFHSQHVQLLPYLDQLTLYSKFDLSESSEYGDRVHGTLPEHADAVIASFLCPSDHGSFGNNYRFCTGQEAGVAGDGAFSQLKGYTVGRFKDGLSNTVAVSEAIKSDNSIDAFGPGDYWISSLLSVNRHPSREDIIQTCNALSSPPRRGDYFPFVGHAWALMGYDFTLYNHVATPNAPGYDCSAEGRTMFRTATTSLTGVHKASSQHSGGVNVLMMDGSVRFVADAVATKIWWALASIAGEEMISGTDY